MFRRGRNRRTKCIEFGGIWGWFLGHQIQGVLRCLRRPLLVMACILLQEMRLRPIWRAAKVTSANWAVICCNQKP